MIPRSFDDKTCQALVGDDRQRALAESGRAAADAGEGPPERNAVQGSYWSQVQDEAEYRVKLSAYQKRVDRIERIKEKAGAT